MTSKSTKRYTKIVYYVIVFIIIYILAMLTIQGYCGSFRHAQEAHVKQNIYIIKNALDSFANEHDGIYPLDTESLISEGYLNEFPDNPITKGNEPMHEIGFRAKPSQGNFTYLPVSINGKIHGYYLFAYGFEKRPIKEREGRLKDIDRDGKHDWVIIVVEPENESIRALMPPLEDLLN